MVELASTTSKHLKTVSETFLSCDQSTWLVKGLQQIHAVGCEARRSAVIHAGGRSVEATLAGPGLSAGQETLQVPGHGPRRGITPLRVLCQCSHQDTFQPLR